MLRKPLGLAVALALLAGCASDNGFHYTPPAQTLIAPEAASGWLDKQGWQGHDFMVAAANPLAVDAGYQIIKAGGSAVDAAIAVQLVLTLVEPQSSGIGGGTLLLVWDGRKVGAVDGRETAPAAATDQLFMQDGKPLAFYDGVVGGRSVGVPGTLRALALAHQRYGKLPWAALFEPAITLAEQGFVISPRLATLLAKDPYLARDPEARAYFYQADGSPKTAGTRLTNPALAKVLRTLATEGADAFYRGSLADAMVAKVRQHPTNPGVLAATNLASYQAKLRDGLCFDYRQSKICGFPTPSSGTLALGQIFGMLESRDMAALKPITTKEGDWQPPARPSTSTAKRRVSPLPIATSTSPTAILSACRCRGCWTRAIWPSGASLSVSTPWGLPSPARRHWRWHAARMRLRNSPPPAMSRSSTRRGWPSP